MNHGGPNQHFLLMQNYHWFQRLEITAHVICKIKLWPKISAKIKPKKHTYFLKIHDYNLTIFKYI